MVVLLSENNLSVPKKFGVCSVDNCSCCASEKVCRLKPEFGEGSLNSECTNYFSTVTALEISRKVPVYGNSPASLADRFSVEHPVLSVESGLSDSELYKEYVSSPFVVAESESLSKFEVDLRSPSASFDGLGGRYGDIEIVGRGEVTNLRCGKFRYLKACLNVDLHHNSLVGNFEGKAYVKVVHTWCHNPRCPVCFKRGYAVREARSAAERIEELAKHHDSLAEHIIYSVSLNDYALSLEKLRAKARKDLIAVGVTGGALIFHGFRFANHKTARIKGISYGWYWAPHFHCVGFIRSGYSHCRRCKKVKRSRYGMPCEAVCHGCSGFENKVRKYREGHGGVIIKIADNGRKRQTIEGTFWYQLHHASLNVAKKQGHPLTWFGSCNSNKLKIEHKKHVDVCPLCQHELVKVRYFGSAIINVDRKSSLFKPELYLDAFEDGRCVFEVLDDDDKGYG